MTCLRTDESPPAGAPMGFLDWSLQQAETVRNIISLSVTRKPNT